MTDQLTELISALQDNTEQLKLLNQKPDNQWKLIYSEDWLKYPLNVEMPDDQVPWSTTWDPWTAGTEYGHASVQVVQQTGRRALQCSLMNPFGGDNGARAFRNLMNQWDYYGQFEGQTLRERAKVTYTSLFQIESGEGMYCQVFKEFKTLDTKRTAVQVLLEQDGDKLVHWGVIGDQDIHPAVKTPILFGVPLDYELQITFKRDNTGHMRFQYGESIIEGDGRTLNLTTGKAGGAFLFYSNAIKGNASVQYSDFTIELKVA